MGEVMTEFRSLAWRSLLPVVLVFALVFGGCASSSTTRAADETAAMEPTSAEASGSDAIALKSLDLREGAPGALLDLRGDGPLIWTSYRDEEGQLVIELPNTVLDPAVQSLAADDGLVSYVQVMAEADSGRPLTKLVVSTRGESEHTVTAQGDHMEVHLTPLGAQVEAAVASLDPDPAGSGEEVAEIAMPAVDETASQGEIAEPLAGPVVTTEVAETIREPVAEPALSPIGSGLGTPEVPWVGPEPQGIRATRLDEVNVGSTADGTQILLAGDGDFAFTSFLLDDPPRFVVDLQGVADLTGESLYPVDSPDVAQVRVAQFQSQPEHIARVVFDLQGAVLPSVTAGDEGLLVQLGGTAVPMPASTQLAEAAPAGPVAELPETVAEPIRFEAVTASIENEPAADAELPPIEEVVPDEEESWAAEAATPLVSDVALFEAQDAEIPAPAMVGEPVVGAAGGFAATEVRGQQKQYYGEPMSLSLKDADIKDVLRSFSKISGLNVVVQPGVRGTVTVELESVPWDQALEQILKVNQLGMVLEGNILRIAPITVLRQEAQEEARLRAAQSRSQPLRTVIKRLSYAQARDILTLMSARRSGVRVMSSRGKMSVDSRTNTLIIKELPSYMDTVISIIEHLDSPEPQVMIEARIVETIKNLSSSLGLEWAVLGAATPATGNTTGLQFPATAVGGAGVNLLSGGDAGLLSLSMANLTGSFGIDVTLQAFESQGLVNVLSAPRIATLNNERASIQSGLQIPVQTVRNNTVTVQYINATLRLEVTPQVTAEGTILMDIRVQKREPDLAFAVVGATNAPINTKEARTSLMVRDGGTTVIGGIYEIAADKGEDRVPGLANIPIIGSLFRNQRKTQENKELLIFITPRIIQF